MLDLYLIQDDQPKPDYPEQAKLEFAGGLDATTFANLQNKGIIASHYDYYSDFRWSAEVIEQQHEKIKLSKLVNDTDIKRLTKLLNKAQSKNTGLIAYCD